MVRTVRLLHRHRGGFTPGLYLRVGSRRWGGGTFLPTAKLLRLGLYGLGTCDCVPQISSSLQMEAKNFPTGLTPQRKSPSAVWPAKRY